MFDTIDRTNPKRKTKSEPLVNRWNRQSTTDYGNLPNNEQDSDRKEADKFLALLRSVLMDGQDLDTMLIKTVNLKQIDGEGWAAGQFLQEVLQVDRRPFSSEDPARQMIPVHNGL